MKIQVSLDEMQRQQVEEFRRATRSRLEARRCRIILLLDEGKTIREVRVLVDCVRSTAYRTLYQFEEDGLNGLLDQRTKRKPYKATAEVREQLLNYLDKARRIHIVLDNYIIRKSKATKMAIEALDGRVQLHFLPPYSPESNRIEPLWKQFHDHVIRNHQHPDIKTLVSEVEQFLVNVQPFPGNKFSTLEIAS
jgi:transposase